MLIFVQGAVRLFATLETCVICTSNSGSLETASSKLNLQELNDISSLAYLLIQ